LVFHSHSQTEEEKEAMEEEKNKVRGEQGGSLQYEENQVAMELLKQAENMEVDLANKAGIKKAATDFLELVKGKIDLPENRNPTMELGKLMMANHDKSPKGCVLYSSSCFFSLQYGFVEVKAEQAKSKEAAVQANCANPANAALILAFQECSRVSILCIHIFCKFVLFTA
jgi:hypothetical protein